MKAGGAPRRWELGAQAAPRDEECAGFDALVIALPADAWSALPELLSPLGRVVAAWRARQHRGAVVLRLPALGDDAQAAMLRAAVRALLAHWPSSQVRLHAVAGADAAAAPLVTALLDEAPLTAALPGQLVELPDAASDAASDVAPDAASDAASLPPGAIAIVGMGIAVPRASSPDELWALLCSDAPVFDEPGDRLSLATLWSADPAAPDRTYSRVAGFLRDLRPHPKLVEEEASGRFTSPELTARWLRHCVLQATERVHLAPGDRQLFAIGLTPDGSHHLEHSLVASAARTAGAGPLGPGALPLAGAVERYLPYRIARDAAGPLPPGSEVIVVDTACSSSLYTIDLGVRALRAGETDVALCGGAFALNAQSLVLFSKLQGLSRSGQVRSLDAGADGVLFSDGAAMLVLKTAARARADGDEILGYVAGFGGSSDGRGKAIYAPNAAGQRLALHRAWSAAAVTPDDVDWLIAHATGTPTGDKTELTALTENAPSTKPWTVTSNKSLIGHSGWAAGAVSAVHALLALRHQRIPAQRRFTALPRTADGAIAAKIDVPTTARAWPRRADAARRVAVSAMGFGGTNGHLLLSDRPSAGPRDRAAASSCSLVITAWAAHLPGSPSQADVIAWARGAAPSWPAGFGDAYPLPSPVEAKLSPSALAAMDRTQLMALGLADQLGGAWSKSGELAARTGVYVGHCGPTRAAVAHDLRCYLDELAARSPDLDAAALRRHADLLVRPAREDSYPGLMPNIIAARVVQRLDLHGPNMTIDAGRDSTLAALVTAARALRDGEIDAALVLGVNATTAHVAAPPGQELAEAAIGFVLMPRALAEQRGLPVLAELARPGPSAAAPGASADRAAAAPGDGRHYRGAEGAVQLLRALHRGSCTLVPVEDSLTPALAVSTAVSTSISAAVGAAVRAPDARALRLDEVLARHAIALVPRPGRAVRPPAPLFLEPTLVVTDLDEAAAAALPLSAACRLARTLDELPEQRFRHVLVLSGPEARHASATAALTPKAALCDLAFAAAQRSAELLRDGGSYCALLLDAFLPDGARPPRPATGLFGGLIRSLEQELAGCTTLALYVDHAELAAALAALRDESAHHRLLPLAYLREGQRLEQALCPAPLSTAQRAASARIPERAVVLATGGARGLTAHLVEQLCDESLPRAIWLIGSGPPPAAAAAALPAERAAALRALMVAHPGENMAKLNRRYEAAQQEAERAATLRRLEARVGAGHVHYRQCDLLDASAVRTLVAEILEREAGIDVVLHGAGLVRTAVLARKQLADLRAVRDVKALGYAHLRDALDAHPAAPRPALWCSLSSVSAFMGRSGEADYCGGNEYLLLAAAAARARGHDELAFVSALWVESGMASANTVGGAFLVRQGDIGQMSDAQGREFFAAELRGRGEARGPATLATTLATTWIGDADWATVERKAPGLRQHGRAAAPPPPAFLGGAAQLAPGHWLVDVTLERHPYLLEHLVDGRPTLPGTFILELAAEAAAAQAPGLRPVALADISLSRFIRAPRDRWPRRLCVVAARAAEDRVAVRITTPAHGPVAELEHARMLVHLAARPSEAPRAARVSAGRPAPDTYQLPGTPVQLAGPFRAMAAPTLTGDGGVARLDFAALAAPLDPAAFAGFLLPSLSLDCLLRTIVLDGRDAHAATIGVMVPTAIERVELFTGDDDRALAERFPTGVQLRHLVRAAPGASPGAAPGELHECLALSPEGEVLFRASGIRGAIRAVADLASGAWTTAAPPLQEPQQR